MRWKRFTTIAVAALIVQAGHAQDIPLDTAVHTGRLANGLTYYIRHNAEPQRRVVMYLVNKVGSVLEEENQRGLAHFMEHMNFNGTKHYPKNELEDYLQKAGVRFGADLNAYTSFDETVFELPIPTDDPSMVSRGLGIIRDWAQDALLDSTDIAEEKGVVLEEERLGKGAGDRMQRQYFPMMLNHSRYAERIPIGQHDVLTGFEPAALRSFHHDWYRPDLQAVIVVGDVNVNEVEQIIRTQFSDLVNPADERPRTVYGISLTGENHFVTVTDKEQPVAELNILIKHKAPGLKTEQDYLEALKRSLFGQMLTARYAELGQRPGIPFVSAGAGIQDFMGGLDVFAFSLSPKEGQFQQAFREAWQVVEQVKRYGFTQTELDRARKNFMSQEEAGIKEKDKTPSASFVKQYQSLFLHQEAAPSIDWEYRYIRHHISSLTPADINALSQEYIRDDNRDILVIGPDKEKNTLPDSLTVTGWIQSVAGEKLEAYQDVVASGELMAAKPKPGKITAVDSVPSLGLTLFTLSNGVKVILKPTDFKNNEILFTGFTPGGLSLCSNADYLSAANAAPLINSMGLDAFTPVGLSKILSGKIAGANTYIAGRSEGVQGSATPADLETALQLLYLRYTSPRIDTALFNNIISGARASLANRYASPENVFADTISQVMGGYSYRSRPMSLERLDSISLQKALRFYKERFADASGLTILLVGNVNMDSIRPLLEMYLGGLPSLHRQEKARDLGIHIPEGQITRIVRKGSEDKATVDMVLSGSYAYSSFNNVSLHMLGEVLQIKLLQHLREAAAEVYSPSVRTDYTKYPKNRYSMTISFGCAPKNVAHLVSMVDTELETLRNQGPDPVDLEKAKVAYLKQMEQSVKTNSFWLTYLSGKYENGEDPLNILKMNDILDQVTPASLQAAARDYLSGHNVIRFELLPE